MFRLIVTMRRGSASGIPQAWARYAAIETARAGAAELLRDDRVVRDGGPERGPAGICGVGGTMMDIELEIEGVPDRRLADAIRHRVRLVRRQVARSGA